MICSGNDVARRTRGNRSAPSAALASGRSVRVVAAVARRYSGGQGARTARSLAETSVYDSALCFEAAVWPTNARRASKMPPSIAHMSHPGATSAHSGTRVHAFPGSPGAHSAFTRLGFPAGTASLSRNLEPAVETLGRDPTQPTAAGRRAAGHCPMATPKHDSRPAAMCESGKGGARTRRTGGRDEVSRTPSAAPGSACGTAWGKAAPVRWLHPDRSLVPVENERLEPGERDSAPIRPAA